MNITVTQSLAARKLFPQLLVAGVLFLNFVVAGVVWYTLQKSKALYQEQAEISAKNLSEVLDTNLTSSVSKIDLALQAVTDEAKHQLANGPLQERIFNNFITRQHSRLPELVSFRATNPAGDAIYGPKTDPQKTISLAHRDYFAQLRDNPDAGLVISKPLIGGITGKWMLVFARRFNRPDGSFAGIVYGGLGLDDLTKSFSILNIGDNGEILLLDADLRLVARHPRPASGDVYNKRFITMQQLERLVASNTESGEFTDKSSIDDVERTFSFHTLLHNTKQPFYIITGVSSRDYLAVWHLEVFKMSLFMAVFLLVSVVSLVLFRREWNKTWEAQQALSVLNTELEQRVTERTATAEKLSNTMQAMIECMSDWVWEIDAEGKYTYCSPNVKVVLGYRPDEMVGKTPFDFMDKEEAELILIQLSTFSCHKAQIKDLENWNIARDGRRVLFSTNGVPILDEVGNLAGYRGVDTDITERKRAEMALYESNERFSSAFQNAPNIMAITSLEDGRCLDVNQRFLEISGFSREGVIGKSVIEIGWITPSERDKIVRAIRAEGRVNNLELIHYTKSGKERILSYSGQLIPVAGEKRLLSIVVDITEKRLMEQQLFQAQKMDAIGQLAGGIAHDFNNKLMVIHGNAALACMEIDDTARVLDCLHEITVAAEHSRQITSQLLGFSRKQVALPVVLDLNSCIENMVKSLSRLIEDRITVTFRSGIDLWQIVLDPVQLDQIVMNMALNARDAMPEGGQFTIETSAVIFDEKQIKTSLGVTPGEYVCISFSDTGTGMDQETVQHIFEPFFTTKEQGKGTGLGLATVHGIVRQNRGVIEVRSEPGQGTVFTVSFPQHAAVTG